jgi:hypothetical protein
MIVFLVTDGSDERFRLIVNLGQPCCTVSLGYIGASLVSFFYSGCACSVIWTAKSRLYSEVGHRASGQAMEAFWQG